MAGCFGTLKPAEEKGLLSARFGDDDEVNGATVSTDGGAGPDAIYTIGHGTLPAEALMELLEAQDITWLVDIRSFPGSRHNPQFGREEMERWVPAAGIDYRWLKVLGGRRRSQDESRHMALRHPAFRSYADYMETNDFASGMAQLLTLATEQPTAIMCSESVWWKCHRRLVSDHLVLIEHIPVLHVMHTGKLNEHPPLAEARVEGNDLVYDVGTLGL